MSLTDNEMLDRMNEYPLEEILQASGIHLNQLYSLILELLSDDEVARQNLEEHLTDLDNINEDER